MLVLAELVVTKNCEIEIAKGESQSCKYVSSIVANMSVFFGIILRDHIEYHGEHNDKNHEEQHEHLKVINNHCNHSNDVRELFDNSHEEENLHQAQQNHTYQQDLRPNHKTA